MKAKITQPVRKREVLQDAIPLSTPYYICLDVSSACNIVCNYCVHYDLTKVRRKDFCNKIMNVDLAKKAIDDLKDFPNKVKVLSLYGWGEPLLNPNIADIIAYSRQSGAVLSTETISNGILLTPELSDKLISAGLQRINISVQSVTPEGYEEICGKRIDIEKYANNIRYLYEHKPKDMTIYIKIGDIALKDEEDIKQFYDLFGDICDEIFIEKIINVRDDSIANDNIGKIHDHGVFGQKVQGAKVCPYLFFRMFICPDGTCALCNADWYRSITVGNINEQSLKEIWQGDKLRNIQLTHLYGNRNTIDLCSKCGNIKYYTNPADNLDAYAEELIKRIERSK